MTNPNLVPYNLLSAIRKGLPENVKCLTKELRSNGLEHVNMNNLLMDAIEYNQHYLVKSLIHIGVVINGLDNDSPLHKACIRGRSKITDILLEAGAEVDRKDSEGRTPLHCAVDLEKIISNNRRKRYLQKISCDTTKILLKHGANLNATDFFGRDPLHLAVSCGNSVAFLLIKDGANVERKDEEGRTPAHCAILTGNINMVRKLVLAGVSLNSTDFYGNTILHGAVEHGSAMTELVLSYLSRLSETVNVADIRGLSPLHLASAKSDYKTVRMLVDIGADVEQLDHGGNTPLLHACSPKSSTSNERNFNKSNIICKVVNILLQEQADIYYINKNGFSALHLATLGNLVCVVKILLDNGASVNGTSSRGETALHLGVKSGALAVCLLLHNYGANIESRDSNGRTPIQMINYIENSEMRKTLLLKILEWDPDINSKDKDGNSLLHNILAMPGELTVIRNDILIILIEHGANVISDPTIDNFIQKHYRPASENQVSNKESLVNLAFTLYRYKFKLSQICENTVMSNVSSESMTSFKLDKDYGLSYYTLLTQNIHPLAAMLLRNSSIKESCTEILKALDNDGDIREYNIIIPHNFKLKLALERNYLANKLKKILRRVELLDAGILFFRCIHSRCKYPRLVYPCCEAITSYLNNNDLRNLGRLMEGTNSSY